MSRWISVNVDVDVDIDDVLYQMSSSEKQEFADNLYEEGFKAVKDTSPDFNDPETEFDKACLKLFGNGWRMTKEQEDYIIELGKRFL
jgi:hypothetical protein